MRYRSKSTFLPCLRQAYVVRHYCVMILFGAALKPLPGEVVHAARAKKRRLQCPEKQPRIVEALIDLMPVYLQWLLFQHHETLALERSHQGKLPKGRGRMWLHVHLIVIECNLV